MKNLAAALAAAAALIAAGALYPATMEITNISGDVVTMETATGHVYQMDGAEDYETGDLLSVLMYSNGTEAITDDIILAARFSGYQK